MVENCVNFNSIGEAMSKLEILNRRFTSKAGEWALKYLSKPSNVKNLSEIKSLDLSGRGVLGIENIKIFKELTGLKYLNIKDHEEILMTEE